MRQKQECAYERSIAVDTTVRQTLLLTRPTVQTDGNGGMHISYCSLQYSHAAQLELYKWTCMARLGLSSTLILVQPRKL
jgi:hypothetical protein